MKQQIIEIAAYFGIAANDTDAMQAAYQNGNSATSLNLSRVKE